ncbi:hypothetical protein C8Q73DRAFT_654178, partial [Cubamyces lactineus]
LIENHLILASSVLLWYDFALTLAMEYRRIWQREFSGATIVYFTMRYIAVIERVFLIHKAFVLHSSEKVGCGGIAHVDDALVFLNYLAFSAFICLRVYGVCGRNWTPLLAVLLLTIVGPILGLYEAAHYVTVSAGPPVGCVYIYDVSSSVTMKATTITAGVILVVLTWMKTVDIKRQSLRTRMHTPLADLLLRDGTYRLFTIGATKLVLISLLAGDRNSILPELAVWLAWPYFSQVITSICLSRFMLDLRGLQFADRLGGDVEEPLHWSDVHVYGVHEHDAPYVIENLDGPLRNVSPALSVQEPAHGNL